MLVDSLIFYYCFYSDVWWNRKLHWLYYYEKK